MPDAAAEIVYTGAAKPPSWGVRAGRFVREKIIAPHTPEAHYDAIMKKYFWVTDRLEGPSLELAQRVRSAVELYAKAAGWSQSITELYLAGSAVAVTAILAGKGIKSAAEVFGGMARRHGGRVENQSKGTGFVLVDYTGPVRTERSGLRPQPLSSAANLLGPGEQYTRPPHIHSKGRFALFSAVTARIRGDGRKAHPPSPAKPRPPEASRPHALVDLKDIAYQEMMKTVGVQAVQFGGYLKEHLSGLPDEQRRHAQRAYAQILKGLLSENGSTPAAQRDVPQAFVEAIEVTKPRAGGLSGEHIAQVVAALGQFSNLGKKLASQGQALRS